MTDDIAPATLAVTAGRPARTPGAPVNAAIGLSSTFVSTGVPQAGVAMYGRYDAPAWHPFEEALGALEGAGLPALVFASGMASIDAVLSLVPPAPSFSSRSRSNHS